MIKQELTYWITLALMPKIWTKRKNEIYKELQNDFSDILRIFLVQIFSGNKDIDYTIKYLDESYIALGYRLKDYIIERKKL